MQRALITDLLRQSVAEFVGCVCTVLSLQFLVIIWLGRLNEPDHLFRDEAQVFVVVFGAAFVIA